MFCSEIAGTIITVRAKYVIMVHALLVYTPMQIILHHDHSQLACTHQRLMQSANTLSNHFLESPVADLVGMTHIAPPV